MQGDYRDKLYGVYASSHTSRLYKEETLATIRAQGKVWGSYFGYAIPERKDARVLDIGCGTGSFVQWLHERGYSRAEGIDVSGEQVKVARKLGIENIQEGDLRETLRSSSGRYDVIVARDVLEHFTKGEVLEILELVHRALTPGGVFIAQTVNGESPFAGRLRYGDFTHENCFTKSSMEQILAWAGFSRIVVRSQPPIVHGAASFVRRVCFFVAECLLRAYLLVETGSSGGILTQNLIVAAWKRT